MDAEDFYKSQYYMQVIKSREQLAKFESVSYPKMSASSRKALFKKTKDIAIPTELDTREVLTTEQAGQQARKFLNGK